MGGGEEHARNLIESSDANLTAVLSVLAGSKIDTTSVIRGPPI